MKTVDTPNTKKVPSNTNIKSSEQTTYPLIIKEGKEGLRFGPVVTGQVALGKDGCGY